MRRYFTAQRSQSGTHSIYRAFPSRAERDTAADWITVFPTTAKAYREHCKACTSRHCQNDHPTL